MLKLDSILWKKLLLLKKLAYNKKIDFMKIKVIIANYWILTLKLLLKS